MVAIALLMVWGIATLLLLPLSADSELILVLAIALRTFLQTGLFVTAHDAMHRSLCSKNEQVNNGLGRLSLWLYAGLSYDLCQINHSQHHRYPAQEIDPDFHESDALVLWYFNFIGNYLSHRDWLKFSCNWILLIVSSSYIFQLPILHAILFFLMPLWLSSLQLFIFGTYLPHRRRDKGLSNRHAARSSDYPVWLSLLTCYHFGYHWEHHEYPCLPWYRLPVARWQSDRYSISNQDLETKLSPLVLE
jgi:beta-carotene/zeaxanthin 4-ketolase